VKYSELHKEEKQEKMAILAKYEKLWEELNINITDHARQIIQSQKRYYFILVLCSILITIAVFLVFPKIVDFFEF